MTVAFTTFVETAYSEGPIPNGELRTYRHYFGGSTQRALGPQAFMVEMPERCVGTAHFHGIDQFQVFFGSPGSQFQRREISGVLLQYTDAYSTYGPFTTAEQPMKFFTLRPEPSLFTAPMPGSRDKLVHRGKRQYQVELGDVRTEGRAAGVATRTLIPTESDGLSSVLVTVGAGGEFTDLPPNDPRGQYYCVLGGTAHLGDRLLPDLSIGWCDRGDAPPTFVAGAQGFDLLVLRFPFPSSTSRFDQSTAGQPSRGA